MKDQATEWGMLQPDWTNLLNLSSGIQEAARTFKRLIKTCSPIEARNFIAQYLSDSPCDGETYDAADVLFREAIQFHEPSLNNPNWIPDQIDFRAIPIKCILEFIGQAQLGHDHTIWDMGSGPGLSAVQFRILSGAQVLCCDYQGEYVEAGRHLIERNNISGIEFYEADARDVDYSRANVFHLFYPFKGSVLEYVIQKIHYEALQRPIVITSLGPCTGELLTQSWLVPLNLITDQVNFRPVVFSNAHRFM